VAQRGEPFGILLVGASRDGPDRALYQAEQTGRDRVCFAT
jgi:PleD family two-component response regulator